MLFFGLCIFVAGGVNAKAAGAEPKFGLESCSVAVDSTYRLKVYNLEGRSVIFRSSDTSIVTVTNSGRLKGRNCGDAVVTALVIEDGSVVSTLQCDVHIGPAAVSVKFTVKKLVLKEGAARKIYPLVIPKNTVETPIYWTDDSSIATISSSGTVRAQGVGSVDIHGMIENGDSDVCQVIVLSKSDYEDYRNGERSLEEILSGDSNEGVQDEQQEAKEETVDPKQNVAVTTPTPAPTATPVANNTSVITPIIAK